MEQFTFTSMELCGKFSIANSQLLAYMVKNGHISQELAVDLQKKLIFSAATNKKGWWPEVFLQRVFGKDKNEDNSFVFLLTEVHHDEELTRPTKKPSKTTLKLFE